MLRSEGAKTEVRLGGDGGDARGDRLRSEDRHDGHAYDGPAVAFY